MSDNLVCWKCGESIADLAMPLARHAACRSCGAQLHVCRLCRFYDKTRSNQCQEPIAEPVTDKERANFCELFQVKANAFQAKDTSAIEAAKNELNALFGDSVANNLTSNDADNAKSDLEKLFGMDKEDKEQ